jgi:uncharacterized Zn finger protein
VPRESAFDKGRRLLAEGRVRLLRVGPKLVDAVVWGDSAAEYRVGYACGGPWTCTCPAFGACSHVQACQLVTLVGGPVT